MIALPATVTQAATLEDAAKALGEILELGGPAPEQATQRAIDNPVYAKALLAARKMPQVRNQLLIAPETVSIATPDEKTAPRESSNLKAASKAAKAMLKWGAEGLRHSEPWVIERRLAACKACPHQEDAPDTLVYRGAKVVVGKDAKICAKCDCLTNTKAAMATEHCPEKDPENNDLSRWQEPWIDVSEDAKWPWA